MVGEDPRAVSSTASHPATINGQRFVGVVVGLIIVLLVVAFAGWFWTKANRANRNQIGVPMQPPPRIDRPAIPEK